MVINTTRSYANVKTDDEGAVNTFQVSRKVTIACPGRAVREPEHAKHQAADVSCPPIQAETMYSWPQCSPNLAIVKMACRILSTQDTVRADKQRQ